MSLPVSSIGIVLFGCEKHFVLQFRFSVNQINCFKGAEYYLHISVIKIYMGKKPRSKVAVLVQKLIKQISVSKNHWLCLETIAAIINLIYDQQTFFYLSKMCGYVKAMEAKLTTVASPLRGSKILRRLVKYHLLTGNKSHAARYYCLWKTTIHKFKIKAQNLESK